MAKNQLTSEQMNRLPRWVREYIQRLLHELQEATALAGLADVQDSPVSWSSGLSESVRLPARADVRFQLNARSYIDVGMREVHALAEAPNGEREFVLRVNAGGAWSRLLVHPQASNAVEMMARY